MSKKLQVFISSTYTDLIEDRQAAVEGILDAGHIPAGMELFRGGKPQMQTIKKWIDKSDVYMLILGGRYGSIESSSGKSYTHLEYEYAVSRGMPLFSVILDDNELDERVRKNGKSVIETIEGKKYEEFKSLVKNNVCTFFDNSEKLKREIYRHLDEFSKDEKLIGWVRSDEVIKNDIENEYKKRMVDLEDTNSRLIAEIERLNITNLNDEESVTEIKEDDEQDINKFDHSTTFFSYRIAKAFPGIRGLRWFNNPKEAIDRLQVLLRYPLSRKDLGEPIWFYRGSSCLDINRFERISDEKCLIGYEECLIDRIFVYRSDSYKRSFVYVELKPEEPIGVYQYEENQIENSAKYHGYYNEEYGTFKGYPVTREEFDDGSAFIDGKLVEFNGEADLRLRYLTKYNFIICAKFHPFNSNEGDRVSKKYLDDMLKGLVNLDDFIEEVERLSNNRDEDY
jgi:hypothetical protein